MNKTQATPINIGKIIQKKTRLSAIFIHLIAQRIGVQFTDIHCLNYLMNNGPGTAGSIAKITGLTTGAVTAMLDRLENAGFVKRESDLDDRRKTIIKLQSKNFQQNDIVNTFFTKDVIELILSYSPKEREIITRWIVEMTDLLQEKIDILSSEK